VAKTILAYERSHRAVSFTTSLSTVADQIGKYGQRYKLHQLSALSLQIHVMVQGLYRGRLSARSLYDLKLGLAQSIAKASAQLSSPRRIRQLEHLSSTVTPVLEDIYKRWESQAEFKQRVLQLVNDFLIVASPVEAVAPQNIPPYLFEFISEGMHLLHLERIDTESAMGLIAKADMPLDMVRPFEPAGSTYLSELESKLSEFEVDALLLDLT
jgi:hypothetical protein